MNRKPEITFNINKKTIKRDDIVQEEIKRAKVAMQRLDVKVSSENMDEIREALIKRKMELGHENLKKLCDADVKKAARIIHIMRFFSFGKVKPCRIEVFAKGISAKEFIKWFEHTNEIADEASLLAAHPEHYIINNTPDGRQEIYETNGGSPYTASFIIDFSDKEDSMNQSIPGYPYTIAGKAINEKGKKVGGSMHQFQDTEYGLHGILSIDYPYLTPSSIMNGHKIHLAIEFSNWIEAAAKSIS